MCTYITCTCRQRHRQLHTHVSTLKTYGPEPVNTRRTNRTQGRGSRGRGSHPVRNWNLEGVGISDRKTRPSQIPAAGRTDVKSETHLTERTLVFGQMSEGLLGPILRRELLVRTIVGPELFRLSTCLGRSDTPRKSLRPRTTRHESFCPDTETDLKSEETCGSRRENHLDGGEAVARPNLGSDRQTRKSPSSFQSSVWESGLAS